LLLLHSVVREHSAQVQALQDFSISVNLEHLFVVVASNFGSNQCVSLSISGARVAAAVKFDRGKED
jgi:VCBS repeat-containing protein